MEKMLRPFPGTTQGSVSYDFYVFLYDFYGFGPFQGGPQGLDHFRPLISFDGVLIGKDLPVVLVDSSHAGN